MSWLSLDCTQICLQRWNVTDQDLNLSQIFSVFLFSSRSSSPYSPQPLRHEDHVLSTRVFYSNMWITRAGVQTSGRQHLQDMTYMEVSVRFMTAWNVCIVHVLTPLYFYKCTHSLSHFCVVSCAQLLFTLSTCRQDRNIAVWFEFGMKLRWQKSVTQRFLFEMGDSCYSSGFCLWPSFQLSAF